MKTYLKEYNQQEVSFFVDYVHKLKTEEVKKNGQWEIKNPWASNKEDKFYVDLFKKNALTGLPFDGKHVIVTSRGLSYDYIAYKNRLLLAYPETELSFSEVYKGDDFSFSQSENGVKFNHKIASPFSRDTKNIIGVYCVIKNKRGHFLTLLDKNEINKHKQKATTQMIWSQWELEMILKTVIKKATRIHFEDIYKEINDEDNKYIDLDKKHYKQLRQMSQEEKEEMIKDFKEVLTWDFEVEENLLEGVKEHLEVVTSTGGADLTNIRKWLHCDRSIFKDQVNFIIKDLKNEN